MWVSLARSRKKLWLDIPTAQCAPEAIMGLEVAGRSEGSLTCFLTKRLVSSQADIARVTTSCL